MKSWTLGRFLRHTIVCGSILYTTNTCLVSAWWLSEDSMEPTFRDGQLVLAQPWPWCGPLVSGDVLILKHPQTPAMRICKRVKALPGETHPLESTKTIPKGHVWVEGDNTSRSMDSKTYGPVPIGLTEGRVVVRLAPFATETAWNPRRAQLPSLRE
eukprot:snap_masked-scaffold139_size317827-processed-gene-1.7 protein:Tk05010 transcript:snap_masked-scaffold139_size317827-processed-gene-1.7-mRNA-1 annotation:"1500034j20rik protein"